MPPPVPWAGRLCELELAPRKAGGGRAAGREPYVLSEPRGLLGQSWTQQVGLRGAHVQEELGAAPGTGRGRAGCPRPPGIQEPCRLAGIMALESPYSKTSPRKASRYLCVPPSSVAFLLSRPLSQAASSWGSCPWTVPPLPQPEAPLCHLPCCFGLRLLESLSSAPLGALGFCATVGVTVSLPRQSPRHRGHRLALPLGSPALWGSWEPCRD